MSWPTALKRFRKLTPADRRAVFQACLYLGATRVAIKTLPFRWIAWGLDRRLPSAVPLSAAQAEEAKRIGWAVTRLSKTRGLHAVCLGQAIAAHCMLRRRGIPCTLHLGVTSRNASLMSHAWVTAGDLFITGESGRERFTEVSRIGVSAPIPGFQVIP